MVEHSIAYLIRRHPSIEDSAIPYCRGIDTFFKNEVVV
jgi:hypothetical protein